MYNLKKIGEITHPNYIIVEQALYDLKNTHFSNVSNTKICDSTYRNNMIIKVEKLVECDTSHP